MSSKLWNCGIFSSLLSLPACSLSAPYGYFLSEIAIKCREETKKGKQEELFDSIVMPAKVYLLEQDSGLHYTTVAKAKIILLIQ